MKPTRAASPSATPAWKKEQVRASSDEERFVLESVFVLGALEVLLSYT